MQKKYLDWSEMNAFMRLAVTEIYQSYGDHVRIGRKTLRKYGQNASLSTSGDYDIVPWADGTPLQETYLTTNAVDSISSSSAADTDIPIYIEGMTRAGDKLTFVTQIVNTDASSGRTRVALTTPLCDVTRMRGVTAGDVYAYVNTALTNGVPTDATQIHCQIVAGKNTSLVAKTSVSSNNYFLVTDYWATIGRASGSNAVDITPNVATLGSPVFGDNFFTVNPWSLRGGSPAAGPRLIPYEIVPPNSRIVMRGQASSGTIVTTAGFCGFFADIVSPELSTLTDDGYEIN